VLWIFVFALNGQSASGHVAAAQESTFLRILACVHVLSTIEEYGRLKARAHSVFLAKEHCSDDTINNYFVGRSGQRQPGDSLFLAAAGPERKDKQGTRRFHLMSDTKIRRKNIV
jgi:hypothetical protein